MRYEHLLQINDPLIPLLDTLTRAQLWRGLVLRMEEPTLFLYGLAGCTVGERDVIDYGMTFPRRLDFGNFTVRDRVTLTPMQQVVVHTEAGAGYAASRLTVRIEEPEPGMLFLRFVYENDESDFDAGFDATTAELRHKAYESSDIDTVRRIRHLAEIGLLG